MTAWLTVASSLPMLAEGAPDEFISAVEDGLRDSQELSQMFADDARDPFGNSRSPHTALLWALEALCRSPNHAARACYALAGLADIDPGGRSASRPLESLRRVLLPWHPQIAADMNTRLQILERILDRYPETGWRLVVSLLPSMYDTTHPTYSPAFRSWPIAPEIPLTERYESWKAITELAISWAVDQGGARVLSLVETIQSLHPADRATLLKQLEAVDVSAWTPAQRLTGWKALTDMTVKHRQFPDAQWTMPIDELEVLEQILERWAPEDPVERYAFLFGSWPAIPFPMAVGEHEQYDREVDRRRDEALSAVWARGGIDDVVCLMAACPEPFSAGQAVAQRIGAEIGNDMKSALAESGALGDAASGWIFQMAMQHDSAWFDNLLDEVRSLAEPARVRAYTTLCFRDEVLDRIDGETSAVQEQFWLKSDRMFLRSDRLEQIATGLIDHGRARVAVMLLSHKIEAEVSSDVLRRALWETVLQSARDGGVADAMLPHEVGVLLDALERVGADINEVAELEWAYFPLLQYSRPPRAIFRRLAEDPQQFVELVGIVYRGTDDTPPAKADQDPDDAAPAARWRTSYSVLREWRTVPGWHASAGIDAEHLRGWVGKAREQLAAQGRSKIGDRCIGELLSGTPVADDGIWPAIPVRDLLERLTTDEIREGFEIGRFNSRGPTSRGIFDGGRQERALADQYESDSNTLAARWPNTARVLRELATAYRQQAVWEDEKDEQWRHGR